MHYLSLNHVLSYQQHLWEDPRNPTLSCLLILRGIGKPLTILPLTHVLCHTLTLISTCVRPGVPPTRVTPTVAVLASSLPRCVSQWPQLSVTSSDVTTDNCGLLVIFWRHNWATMRTKPSMTPPWIHLITHESVIFPLCNSSQQSADPTDPLLFPVMFPFPFSLTFPASYRLLAQPRPTRNLFASTATKNTR